MQNNITNIKSIPIYIINLKTDDEKRNLMKKQCNKLNLKYEFIEAVDGYALSNDEIRNVYSSKKAIDVFKRELSKGEIGCALSHLKIYQKMVDEKINYAVILEDDVEIHSDFGGIIKNFNHIQNECECVLLGHNDDIKRDIFLYISFWHQKKFMNEYRLYKFTKVAFGTYGYIITLIGAEKLLRAIKTIDKPIDHYTGGFEIIDCYGLIPRCVKISNHEKAKSKIVSERDRLKKLLHQDSYDTWIGIWANRARLLVRLCTLKIIPLKYSRFWAERVFQNRRKSD